MEVLYIPPNTHCPMELSTYFRINALNTGQFERTLIIVMKTFMYHIMKDVQLQQRDEETTSCSIGVEL